MNLPPTYEDSALAGLLAHDSAGWEWMYADVHMSRKVPTAPGISREWITILNPNPGKDAHIRITFNYVKEQQLMTLTLPAERVRTIALHDLAILTRNDAYYPVVERR